MGCNVSSFSVGGGRELLATLDKSYTVISDATLLQWKNKYRYLYILFDGYYSTDHYRFSTVMATDDFYDYFVGNNAEPRYLGALEWKMLTKVSSTSSSQYANKYTSEGTNGTTKIYGLTF